MKPPILILILAGGEGRRMGGRKPERSLGEARLIDRAVRQARSWSDVVAVAVRRDDQVSDLEVDTIRDDPDIEGPLAGVAAGLRHAVDRGCELVLSIPADTPFLPMDLPSRLRAAIGERDCAIASSGGILHPACALWRTRSLDRLAEYLATGRRSLQGFADLVGFSEVEWAAVPDDPFFNVNDAADLDAARARIGR